MEEANYALTRFLLLRSTWAQSAINLNISKGFFWLLRVVRCWHSSPRDAAGSPPLAIPKPQEDTALGCWLWVLR